MAKKQKLWKNTKKNAGADCTEKEEIKMQELHGEKPGKSKKERTLCQSSLQKNAEKNFSEVALGYTKEDALAEASRCLACKDPKCVEAAL
nr:hypothetical protein [Methanosarcina horonobensis]